MANNYIVPPCYAELKTISEADDFIVVNKPSGLLSVPGRLPENQDCVVARLLKHYPEIYPAHRLDLDTSGLMLLAKNKAALREFNWQFERRETYKEYTAIVFGELSNDEGKIDLPLICDWPNRPKQMVCHDSGKPSQTHYKALERNAESTRVLLMPITGRSHQLRVHMSAIGHPILGCDFYAHEEAFKAAPRLLLHANRLRFATPDKSQTQDLQCEPEF